MKQIHYTTAFKKDYKAIVKRGLDPAKLMNVIQLLAEDKELPAKYKLHNLQGKWQDFLECHINPDWLLIWSQDRDNIYLTRTGSHSDLF